MPIPKAAFPIIGAFLEFITFPVRLLFGPLFSILDRCLARKEQAEFERKIRRDARVLFEKYGAEVVPNEGVPFPPGFDGAFVTLRADGILIRFEKGRGDFNVRLTSVERPNAWNDLDLLIAAIQTPDYIRRTGVIDVRTAGREIESRWDDLKGVVVSKSAARALGEFRSREQRYLESASKELNRRLYDR